MRPGERPPARGRVDQEIDRDQPVRRRATQQSRRRARGARPNSTRRSTPTAPRSQSTQDMSTPSTIAAMRCASSIVWVKRSPATTARWRSSRTTPRSSTIAPTLSVRSAVTRTRSSAYDRALAIMPDYAHALNNRANTLRALDRHEDAIADFQHLLNGSARLRIRPRRTAGRQAPLLRLARLCPRSQRRSRKRSPQVGAPLSVQIPRHLRIVERSVALRANLRRSQVSHAETIDGKERGATATTEFESLTSRRIFTITPLAHLMMGLFETHDKRRFETIGNVLRSR